MAARHVGWDQRAAWLLATSRLMHPDQDLTQRTAFVDALHARGIAADSTRISRWESGTVGVPRSVAEAYEDVLGLSEGSLSAVTDGVRRILGQQPHHRDDPSRLPGREPHDLDRLMDSALGQRPTGTDWQQLAGELTRYDRIWLRQHEWSALCNRLVLELSRSVGISYVRRYEAAAALIRHPSAQRHMSRALGSFVMHPDTQVVAPVLNLLAEVSEPAAADLVLRMMTGESKGLRRAAASVAAVKLRLGHFTEPAYRHLEAYAARVLRRGEPLEGGLDAFDLAIQLPSASFAAVMDAIGDRRVQAQLGRARSTGELLTRQQAAAVVADLAATVQSDAAGRSHPEPDMMLRRLLRESLLHTHKARRHHAALLLGASPYRHAVSRQCHALTGASNYFLAARAWTVLMRVGHAGKRGDVVLRALSETRPTLQARALVNIGLNAEPIHHGEARAILSGLTTETRGSVRHGTLFALGMSGAEELRALAEHDAEPVRRSAQWWLDLGPAIHDHLPAPSTADPRIGNSRSTNSRLTSEKK